MRECPTQSRKASYKGWLQMDPHMMYGLIGRRSESSEVELALELCVSSRQLP